MSIAAHLIIGQRPEPFLSALLTSLDGVVDTVIVNDNSAADRPTPHQQAFDDSIFAQRGKLIVDRTPFTNFSVARNICLDIHRQRNLGGWAAFIDADEVHGENVHRIVRHLAEVPTDVDFVEGFTWHFFQSPDWYTSIERRLMFFRVNDRVRWENPVHEQLTGLTGKRLILPYVYAHYGHVLPPRRHAEKGRHYSSLGQEGRIVPEDQLDSIDVERYFENFWPKLLHFTGEHPSAARPLIAMLRQELAEQFAQTERLVREYQPPSQRARNALEKLNYEQRWRARALLGGSRYLA